MRNAATLNLMWAPFLIACAASARGLWVNAGHGHLGWTMAVGSAQLLTDLMLNEPTALDPVPFRIDRRDFARFKIRTDVGQ